MATTAENIFINNNDQHNNRKEQRDALLQNKILKIIQIHTFHLEEEIMQLRRSLEEQQIKEEKLKNKIREWGSNIQTWFEERNNNSQTKRTTPPPSFGDHKIRRYCRSFKSSNQIENDNSRLKRNKNIRFNDQTAGCDSIRSLVASATIKSHGKKRKRIKIESTVQTSPTSTIGKTQIISNHYRKINNMSQDLKENNETDIDFPQCTNNVAESIDDKTEIDKLSEQSPTCHQSNKKNNIEKQRSSEYKQSGTSPKIKADAVISNETISEFEHQNSKQISSKETFSTAQPNYSDLKSNLLCEFISSQHTKQQMKQNDNKLNTNEKKSVETKNILKDNLKKDDTKTNKQCTTIKNPYKYKEVVRNRSDRRSLNAHACPECQDFLDAVCYKHKSINTTNNVEIFDKNLLIQNCSRHRERFTPDPPTPDGFWELSFADSVRKRKSDDF